MTRRLILLLAAACAVLPGGEKISAVESIGMTVSDLDRSVSFYQQALSFEKVSESESSGEEAERRTGVFGARIRMARLRLGEEFLDLTEFVAPRGRLAPDDARSNDRWFQHVAIIVHDMDAAYAHLRRHRVTHVSPGPQTLPDWNPNAGGIRAFYFRDPDGHPLEILSFPPGKGDAKWHRATDRMFLGIDHTAIVVADTEASLRFYRDRLGLRIAGESENYGPEQERLNSVFGARLRITALRAASGPGIELLEYISPAGGRLYPAGTQPNDLVYWQTRLLSQSVYAPQSGARPDLHSTLTRDPDGHAIEIMAGR
ncbi:MAG: VOC family protein [Bryobacterales bacterium]|nr:VOC family protein [Bryobacterales bacterium]